LGRVKREGVLGDVAVYFEQELESVAKDIRRIHEARLSSSRI
jgi:hypothetical protein